MKFVTLLLALFTATSVTAQFFFDLNTGYAFPKYKDHSIHDEYDANNFYQYRFKTVDTSISKHKIENIQLNPVKGQFLKTNFGYRKNKWLFSLGFTYISNKNCDFSNFHNKKFSSYYSRIDDSLVHSKSWYLYNYEITIRYYSISPIVSYNFNFNNKISINPYLSLSVDYIIFFENFTSNSSNYFVYDDSILSDYHYSELIKGKYYERFSLSYLAGCSINYSLNDRLSILLDFTYHYKEVFPNNYKQYYSEVLYPDGSKSISTEEIETEYHSINTVILMSSFRPSVGIRYFLGKK